jgi:hypothetical protein
LKDLAVGQSISFEKELKEMGWGVWTGFNRFGSESVGKFFLTLQ